MGISPTCFAGIGRNFMLPREQWCKGAKAYFNTTSFHGKQMLLPLGFWVWVFYILFIRKLKFSKFSLKSAGDETAYNTIYLLIRISNLLVWQNGFCYYCYWYPLLCWKLSAVWSNLIVEQFHCLFGRSCIARGKKNESFWLSTGTAGILLFLFAMVLLG